MAKRGTRNNLYRLNSVIDAEKTVESEGRKTQGDLKSHYYDAIVVGSGIGGLVVATQLAVKGAKVLVLEKCVIPGGSCGFHQRDGFTFDVGSSVMFGFSDKIFNALNSLELKSLEDPIYLLGQFFKKPL